jgi:pimeloyl-ACP methyl ester carboxylesterase
VTHEYPFSLSVGERTLNGIVHPSPINGRRPAVILCHGFKGFMEWGFFPHLARLLSNRGFCVFRFNFSGSGMKPGDELVSDPEAFRAATFTKDLEELRAVIQAVGHLAPEWADSKRVGIVGHSRGGGIALLAAAHDDSRIETLVTWAAVSTFDRLPPEVVEEWRSGGVVPIVNGRTGQELLVGVEVLHDLEDHADELDLPDAARRRSAPWLIIHGRDDETVPVAEAELLHSAAAPPTELHAIAGADHTFGARHPFVGPNPLLTEAMNATQAWLRRYLAPPPEPV